MDRGARTPRSAAAWHRQARAKTASGTGHLAGATSVVKGRVNRNGNAQSAPVRTAGQSAEGPKMSKTSDPKQQAGEKTRQQEEPVATDRVSEEALDKVAGGATVIGRSPKKTQ